MRKHKEITAVLFIILSVLLINISQSFASSLIDDFLSIFSDDSVAQQTGAATTANEGNTGETIDITEVKNRPKFFEGEITLDNSTEVIDKRTINSKTFKNKDGTYTAVIDLKPLHFKDSQNRWQDIDTNLADSQDDQVDKEATKGHARVKFLKIANQDVVSIERRGKQISFRPSGFGKGSSYATVSPNESNRSFNSNKARYRNVYSNTDIEYTVGPDGIKEDIILYEYTGSNTFGSIVKAPGITLEKQSDGSIYLNDKTTGETILVMPAPFSLDSNNESPAEAYGQTRYELEDLGSNNYLIKVVVDDEWLSSPGRVFPVRIDPSFEYFRNEVNATGKSGKVFQSQASINYNGQNLSAGKDADLGNWRSFVQINPTSGIIPSSATIIQAMWSVWMYSQNNSNNSINLTWNVVNDQIWYPTSLTWNNQPPTTYGPSLGISAGGTSGTDYDWKNWDITSVYESWRNGTRPNRGLMLWSSVPDYNWKAFYGAYHSGTGKRPQLKVTWNEAPSATNTDPIGDVWTNDSTPQLNWSLSDPDGDAQTKFQVQVSTNTSFSNIVYDSGQLNSGNPYKTIPSASALSTNTRYYWRVKVYDGYAWSNWSSYTSFRVDVTPPTNLNLKIANDAPFTGTDIVSLNNISATDSGGSGVSQMQFSNDNITWSGWVPYASSYSGWSIAPPLGDGTKKVYAKFKDAMGNISSSSTSSPLDTIVLDTTYPLAAITTPNESDYYSGDVEINGSADDSNFKNSKLEWGKGASPTEWKFC